MKKIKILYIVSSLGVCNGVSSYAMNYLKNINSQEFQIDFITHSDKRSIYYDVIENKGGNVFYIPKINHKNFFDVLKKINKFFKENGNEYDIVHCHMLNAGVFFLYYAKKYNINIRILHSHVTKSSDKILNKIRNDIFLPIAIKNANYYCACSNDAGSIILKNKKFIVIKNAIEAEKYKFKNEIRTSIRKKMNIQDKVVVGNIGRFCPQKNQEYLIQIFSEFKLKVENAVLFLVGDGPDEYRLRELVKEMNIEKDVIFYGTCSDVENIYQVFDVFVLPSRYEGLGIVLIEAQASGLPCLVSSVVPKEAKITDEYVECSLEENPKVWAAKMVDIIENKNNIRKSQLEKVSQNGYDIKKESLILERFYRKLCENKN